MITLYIITFILAVTTLCLSYYTYYLWTTQKTIIESYNNTIDDIKELYEFTNLLQSQIDDDGWIYLDKDLLDDN